MLIGRPEVIARNISDLGLRLKANSDVTIVGFNDDDHHADAAEAYYQRRKRHGLTLDMAKALMRSNGSALGAMLLDSGAADGLLCGTLGMYNDHLRDIEGAIGLQDGVHGFAAINLLQLPRHTLFICDTYVNLDPDAEEITNMTLLAAAELKRFGIVPRVALLSHSDFGTAGDAAAEKMRQALQLIVAHAPDLEIDGEMRADTALSNPLLARVFPGSRLTGDANLLIMPNLGAANITFNALKIVAGQGITVGPILLGAAKPAHILTPTTTVRGIVNMAALTAVGFAKA